MEGHWHEGEPGEGVPLVLFALPDQDGERNRYEVAVPRLGSVILTHSWDGPIQPLTAVPADERPPVAPAFWGLRIMVGLGRSEERRVGKWRVRKCKTRCVPVHLKKKHK